MTYYVYKVTNIINGKFYIGKRRHSNPKIDPYMGSGKLIKLAIEKYGIENFSKEIIEVFETNEEAALLEAALVTKDIITSNKSYNMHEGGHGGFGHINNTLPEERINIKSLREKLRSGKLKVGGDKSSFFTEDSYRRMREGSAKGNLALKNRTKEKKIKTRERQSKAASGENNSQYGAKVYINLTTGEKKRSKTALEGWISSNEYKELQMSDSKRWYNNGVKNFYVYLSDPKIMNLNLVKGRIKTA